MSSSAKAADRKLLFYIGFGISSEAGFWRADRSRLVKLGYEDENSMISPAIISKMNLVKKIKKKLFTFGAKYVIIYVENKERKLKMTKQELNTLSDLLLKLQEERLQEYRNEGYDIDSMDDEEIMELDDGDNLLQGLDIVFGVVQRIRGN